MSQLIRLQDIQATHRELIGDDYYDPTGKTAYGINEEKIGKIEGALVEDTTGRIRYLIVDVGGWFSAKEVLAPAGLARIVGDDVFFDSLTKSQVEAMEVYDHDYQYSYKEQYEKDRRAFGAETLPADERVDIADHNYNAPEHFAPLEERLGTHRDHIAANTPRAAHRMPADYHDVEVTDAMRNEDTLAGLIYREGLDVDADNNIVSRNGTILATDHISVADILRVRNRD
ncbi:MULTISPECIES: PRC-barrel domain-containing protein [unclassified Psychrobacter]|uniref:PRC-barrel domain-containing protein n=1 Tax=unclassified Psychrobacter TaxID=196806 RepID=UPI0018F555A4|nr:MULTISPECIES: PRC-barrel domain-containing protein [unclassified Psychrobacter]